MEIVSIAPLFELLYSNEQRKMTCAFSFFSLSLSRFNRKLYMWKMQM